MVAPYEIGDPVRSYVRVTGSGTDKDATPLVWDLSRSSTVAAAAPVQQTFPTAAGVTTTSSMLKPEESVCKDVGANLGEQRSEASAESEVAPQGGRKRRYTRESGTVESINAPPAKIARGASPAKIAIGKKTNEGMDSAGPSTALPSEQEDYVATPVSNELGLSEQEDHLDTSVSDVLTKVIEECDKLRQENHKLKAEIEEHDQLRKENLELKERLTLFHDLFKNKNRLAVLLRRLNMHQLANSHS